MIEEAGYPVQVTGIGPLFHTHFTEHPVRDARAACDADEATLRDLHVRLLGKGIFLYQGHVSFVSAAHSEQDVETTIKAYRAVLDEMRASSDIRLQRSTKQTIKTKWRCCEGTHLDEPQNKDRSKQHKSSLTLEPCQVSRYQPAFPLSQ